ncbi:hypothetical protein GCM10027405_39010 [Arthrobacter alkaliphilus]
MIKDKIAATPDVASPHRPPLHSLQLLLRQILGLKRRIGARSSPASRDTECAHDSTAPGCAACISLYIHMP